MAEQSQKSTDDHLAADPGGAASVSERRAEPDVPGKDKDLARFADIPLELGVQLDRRRISVRDVLGLDEGALIRLGRSAGENVDLLLHGVLAGSGEIVVIDEMVGLRITDIYSDGGPWEAGWRRPRL